MLRWSAQATDTAVDPRGVIDPTVDPLVPAGRELVAFVDDTLTSSGPPAASALRHVIGQEGLVAAAAVVGNFQMMNIVADATGMPVGKGSRLNNADLIEQLALSRFDHLEDAT